MYLFIVINLIAISHIFRILNIRAAKETRYRNVPRTVSTVPPPFRGRLQKRFLSIFNPFRYSWSSHYFEIFSDGAVQYWEIPSELEDFDPDSMNSMRIRQTKLEDWSELDYKEKLEVQKPYCLKFYDCEKASFIVQCKDSKSFMELRSTFETLLPAPGRDAAPLTRCLSAAWGAASAGNSGPLLGRPALTALLEHLNINMSESELSRLLSRFCSPQEGATSAGNSAAVRVEFSEFVRMYKEGLCASPSITSLLRDMGAAKDQNPAGVTVEELADYLQAQQGSAEEAVTTQALTETIVLTFGGFNTEGWVCPFMLDALLCSPTNSLLRPQALLRDHQDLSRPLCDYLVSSSHNTYLEGNQLSSASTAHMYRLAIQHGCKCVEVDCWDGPAGPVVKHGHTLTPPVDFRDVVEVISTHAFDVSPLPLIISLDDNCSVAHQDIMADTLTLLLGDRIHRPPTHTEEAMPSPLALVGKFLIKGKRLRPRIDPANGREIPWSRKLAELTYIESRDKKLQARLWKSHQIFQEDSRPSDSVSFLEGKVSKVVGSDLEAGRAVMLYNHRNFTRVFPKGTRVDSSNFPPVLEWAWGTQLVALNFQTLDTPFRLNQALFQVGGGCGYVLKPASRLRGTTLPLKMPTKIKINLQVLQARHLPRAGGGGVPSPFVRASLFGSGLFGSKTLVTMTTDTVIGNGFNPKFDDTFEFISSDPEVDMLLLEVWDSSAVSEPLIGYFAGRITDLRPGVRFCPLLDVGGTTMVVSDTDLDTPGVLVIYSVEPLEDELGLQEVV